MRRIGFAFNPTKPEALELRDRAIEWCARHNINTWSSESSDTPKLVEELSGTDGLVVLGGDGTFLRATRAIAVVDVPILGVNSGRIGFLSKVEPEALERTLADLAVDKYAIEERMMLEATLHRAGGGKPAESIAALNDAAIVRGAEVRVMHLEVTIDQSHLANYVADGVVVSTPTGSTAYSFSAGGPILDPTARNLIVTPIAAYLSSIRSIVVSPSHTVRVRLIDGASGLVSIDGREDFPLEIGDSVVIKALSRPIRFIEPPGALPFWELLRQKAALLPA